MKIKTNILAVVAAALIISTGIGSAYAYFTTYAAARGGCILNISDTSHMQEDFSRWTKRVTISNDDGSEPVYIRAKAYGPSAYPLVYSGDKWAEGEDGWYYYNDIVPGGGHAEVLNVQITGVPQVEALKEGDGFHVVVVYESTPVRYHEDGSSYADWNVILEEKELEGGSN